MGAVLAVFSALGCRSLLSGAMGRRGRTAGMLLLSLAAVVGTAWLAFSSSDLAQYRFFTATEEGYRVNVWKTALRLWQTEPIVGSGAGTFTNASRQLRLQTEALDDICAHNDWVQGLAELGLVGAGLGLCVVVLHFAAGWGAFGAVARKRSPASGGGGFRQAVQAGALASLAACAAHSFFDFNLQVPANMLLLAMVLGLLAAPGGGAEPKGLPAIAGKTGLASTAALGGALAVLVWHCHRAETAWILADNSLRAGKPERALEIAREGFSENPAHARLADTAGRASYALFLQTQTGAPERSRHQEEMVGFFKKAADLEPGDAWNFLNLAHAMDAKSADGESRRHYFEAIRIAPFYAAPYEFGGLGFEVAGQRSDAIRYYGLAVSLPGATYSGERRNVLIELEARDSDRP
jgi:tetratricopeptide (TPR) repeat protein